MRMERPKARGKKKGSEVFLEVLTYAGIVITIMTLLMVILDVLIRGIPHLTPDLFAWEWTSENQSMTPFIINTLEMIGLTLVIVVPVGIMTAIYTCEYAQPGDKFVKVVRLMTETLQGIPSIIFGLFGMLFFCYALGFDMSIKSGAFTMVAMTLPLMIRSSEEAFLAVPDSLREAAYGLGARKLRTVFTVVLPSASMGIFSGIILSVGRIVGETAALLYTAGSMTRLASPSYSGRTLAIHMYLLQTEALHVNKSYATAVILLVVTIIINAISSNIEHKLSLERENDD